MPKLSQPLWTLIGCKRRAASTAKEIPDVENVESVKRNCRSHWRGLGCSYRPKKRKPTVLGSTGKREPFQTQGAGIEAGAKSGNFSGERNRDTVETVEVTTVSTSRAQPGY
jgi:hypothetical protein